MAWSTATRVGLGSKGGNKRRRGRTGPHGPLKSYTAHPPSARIRMPPHDLPHPHPHEPYLRYRRALIFCKFTLLLILTSASASLPYLFTPLYTSPTATAGQQSTASHLAVSSQQSAVSNQSVEYSLLSLSFLITSLLLFLLICSLPYLFTIAYLPLNLDP